MIQFPKEKLVAFKEINKDGKGEIHHAFINEDMVEDLIYVRRKGGEEDYQIYLGIGDDQYIAVYDEEKLKKAQEAPIEANASLLWHPRRALDHYDRKDLLKPLPVRAAGVLKQDPLKEISDSDTRKLVEELRSLKEKIVNLGDVGEENEEKVALSRRLKEVLFQLCSVREGAQEEIDNCKRQAKEDPLDHILVEKFSPSPLEAGADTVYFHPVDINVFPVRRDQVLANLDGVIQPEALQVPEYLKQKKIEQAFQSGKLFDLDLENLSNEQLLAGLRAGQGVAGGQNRPNEEMVVSAFSLLAKRKLSPEEFLLFTSLVASYETSPSEKIKEAAGLAQSAKISDIEGLIALVCHYLERVSNDSGDAQEDLQILNKLLPLVHQMLAVKPPLPLHQMDGVDIFLKSAADFVGKVKAGNTPKFKRVIFHLEAIVSIIQEFAKENASVVVRELQNIRISMKLSREEDAVLQILDQKAKRCLTVLSAMKEFPAAIALALVDLFLDQQGVYIPPDFGSDGKPRLVRTTPVFSKENLELAFRLMQNNLPGLVEKFQEEFRKPKRDLVWEKRFDFLIPLFAFHLQQTGKKFSLFTPEQILWLAEQDARLKRPALSALSILFADLPAEQRQPEVNRRLERIVRDLQISNQESDRIAAINASKLLGDKSETAKVALQAGLSEGDVAVEIYAAMGLLRAGDAAVGNYLWRRLNQYFLRSLMPDFSLQNDSMHTLVKYKLPDGTEGETTLFALSLETLEKFPPPADAQDLLISLMRAERGEHNQLLLFRALSHVVSPSRAIEIALDLEQQKEDASISYLLSIVGAYRRLDEKEREESTTQEIFQLLVHPNSYVREEVFSILLDLLGSEKMTKAIWEMSFDPRVEVRRATLSFLASPLLGPEAMQRLQEMQNDLDLSVSAAAREKVEELARSDWSDW